MSSTAVFKSLRELFPQVDLRLLRAISIEHEDNVNEAVEFILSEVLLSSSTTPEASHIFHANSDQGHLPFEDSKDIECTAVSNDKPDYSLGILNYVGEVENNGSQSLVAGSAEDPVLKPPQLMFVDAIPRLEQRMEPSGEAEDVEPINVPDDRGSSLVLPIYVEGEICGLHTDSTKGPDLCPPQLMSVDTNSRPEQPPETFGNNNSVCLNTSHLSEKGCDNIILTECHTKLPDWIDCENVAMCADGEEVFQVNDEENISVHSAEQTILSSVYDDNGIPLNYGSEKDNDINIQLNRCEELSGFSADTCRPFYLIGLETVIETPLAPTSVLNMSTISESNRICQNPIADENKGSIDSEKQIFVSLNESPLELSSKKSDDYNILLTTLATRSGHTVCTDLLEDYIRDAKNSKKTLVSTLESMVSMMQEVELLEEKAKHVKEDTLVANQHILFEVGELQKIVKHSMDKKDMNAGEVYGERSILAAEARELQSRLLKMSDERNEYLSVTEEIFKALEARKAAAQDEITAADVEKHEKEKLLQKALKDKELMMNSIFAESQKLQQEAEENNKLREFLMDRGRALDSLQGEIAIICEDIISLKKKVDGHTPMPKYLSSSWNYGYLGEAPEHTDHIHLSSSSASSSLTNKEFPEEHRVENTTIGRSMLDDWELCET